MRYEGPEHKLTGQVLTGGYPGVHSNSSACCGGCGRELARGETAFMWEMRKSGRGVCVLLCKDCFDEEFDSLCRLEKAALAGVETVCVGGRELIRWIQA